MLIVLSLFPNETVTRRYPSHVFLIPWDQTPWQESWSWEKIQSFIRWKDRQYYCTIVPTWVSWCSCVRNSEQHVCIWLLHPQTLSHYQVPGDPWHLVPVTPGIFSTRIPADSRQAWNKSLSTDEYHRSYQQCSKLSRKPSTRTHACTHVPKCPWQRGEISFFHVSNRSLIQTVLSHTCIIQVLPLPSSSFTWALVSHLDL